jgi:hypothetical protein
MPPEPPVDGAVRATSQPLPPSVAIVPPTDSKFPANDGPEERKLDLEVQRIALEREKLLIEQSKLKLEETKTALETDKLRIEATKARWSAIAAIVPVCVAAATIGYGVYTLRESAQIQMETKVVDAVLQSADPYQAVARARMISRLHAERLDNPIRARLDNLDAGQFGRPLDHDVERKQKLLEALSAHPNARAAILRDWSYAFPETPWIEKLKTAK